MSRLMGKQTIYICENKDADQLRGNREADQRLCFRYTDSIHPLLFKSEISSFQPASVTVQVGLCWTCSETTLLVFPRGGSNTSIPILTLQSTPLLCNVGHHCDVIRWPRSSYFCRFCFAFCIFNTVFFQNKVGTGIIQSLKSNFLPIIPDEQKIHFFTWSANNG